MKKMLYKTDKDLNKRMKTMSILQEIEDKDATTVVNKKFEYKIDHNHDKAIDPTPRVDIIKSADTNLRLEKLHFVVRGTFDITYNRKPVRVNFKHSLNVKIYWKKKIFSPKKSAVLTE